MSTDDFGRYTCVQYMATPVMANSQTVRSTECRRLHHSVGANSNTIVFNFPFMHFLVLVSLWTMHDDYWY